MHSVQTQIGSCRDVFIILRHICILIVIVTIARSAESFLQKMLATVVAQKGGLPMCARMGAIIDGLGLGVSSGIGLTLVRGVPEATGIRTAALAKDCMATKKQGSSHLMTFIYSAGASVPHVRRLLGCHLRLPSGPNGNVMTTLGHYHNQHQV